ncbi:MAG: HAD-IC family P-type ATPase [Oscillatoriales cyanobacterium SM2_2_1]|nr:HAD-IC family P-type ATPase [Oscillatoriales cyanobacterium SM2_2_1]
MNPIDMEPKTLAWHALELGDVLRMQEVTLEKGLMTVEVEHRRRRYGTNTLPEKKEKPAFLKFLEQFNQPLLYILIAAGAIKALLGEYVNAGVIWGVTTTNAIIGYFQESRAESAIAALSQSVVTEAMVLRDGQKLRISSTQLVPGDVVVLVSGDKVPADLRLCQIRDLQIDESALTGESVAVEKHLAPLEVEVPLAERENMAYAGGFVTFGQGTGVVIAIGSATETGKISQLMERHLDLVTPLTRKFNQFSQNWLMFVLFAATMTFAIGLGRRNFKEALEAAVALTVSAIPEGLPAVITVTLAIGVARMANRHAIIRKLPAVETLGSATVVCSDKTGTLTQNEMTVQEIWDGIQKYEVTGGGYGTEGEILLEGAPVDASSSPALRDCLLSGLLCNDTQLELQEQGKVKVVGDPTEAALLVSAQKGGASVMAAAQRLQRLDSIPFESEFQYMATLHRTETGAIAYLKGSAEALLQRCQPDLDQESILRQVDEMAKKGLRVLAFAQKEFPGTKTTLERDDIKDDAIFLGLQGSIDPPRLEAIAAVYACQQAGVKVKMITGDHIVTAKAIAKRMGIRKNRQTAAYTGAELSKMSSEELSEAAFQGSVFARVAPEQKLRIVEALQKRGEIVAMTGDGVNDAPALKQSDIGIAMGSGTEVSKEAADAILTDDNFASIAAAIEEGRSVYKNLVKAISFILPVNGGESMTILISTLLGRELPILSLQVLWLNMLNSIAMTVPLSLEPSAPDVMKQPPRPADEPFLTANRLKRILAVSLYNWTLIFGMFEWVRQTTWGSPELARTMAIQALVFGRIFYLLSISQLLPSLMSRFGSGENQKLGDAPAVMGGIVLAVVLQVVFSNSSFINQIFETAPMNLDQWLICLLVSLPMIGVAAYVNRFDPPGRSA